MMPFATETEIGNASQILSSVERNRWMERLHNPPNERPAFALVLRALPLREAKTSQSICDCGIPAVLGWRSMKSRERKLSSFNEPSTLRLNVAAISLNSLECPIIERLVERDEFERRATSWSKSCKSVKQF